LASRVFEAQQLFDMPDITRRDLRRRALGYGPQSPVLTIERPLCALGGQVTESDMAGEV